MNWLLIVAYLGALVAILLIVAGILYIICYYTSPPDEDAVITNVKPKGIEHKLKDERHKLAAVGEQTMISSLQKSATDNDVVIATAISSIPLKELGGKNNDIIIDVSQKMYLDKDLRGHDEHRCIVCNTRKDIAWNQVSCYAQTTIGVLVYKRSILADQDLPLKSLTCLDPFLQQTQQQDLSAASFNEKPRSVSTTTLAPDPDSRLSIKSASKTKSKSKSNSKFKDRDTPPKSPKSPMPLA